MKKITIIFLIILFSFPYIAEGQNKYTLKIVRTDSSSSLKKIRYQKKFSSKAERQKQLHTILQGLYDKAYLEARYDSISKDTLNQKAYLFAGTQYYIKEMDISRADRHVLEQTGFKQQNAKNFFFTEGKMRAALDAPVKLLEDHGYPFAKSRIDSIIIDHGKIIALLRVETGNHIFIDSLVRKGNIKISRNYMYRYLGIHPGDEYDESRINKIQKRLQDLPFATVIKPFEIGFWKDKAKIFLYLNKRKASNFSGILGVLPNNQVPGKVLINGDVKLHLLNSFDWGELIDLNWSSIQKGTQDLKVHLNYPYIFTTPFGLDYELYLYKQDTSYLTLKNKIGLQYLFSSNNYIQVYADIFTSNIIRASGLENVTVLPDYADIRRTLYGLEVHAENIDYRMNPRKGYRIIVNAAGGLKVIKKNDKVNPVVYDSIKLSTGQVQSTAQASWFIPLLRKHTVLFEFNGGYIWNEKLFDNELFRLGGLNSLRGFDEGSLMASLYGMLLVEYRYLFERNSYLALFWNGAILERKTIHEWATDRPYGFGAGISFETKIGIFSIYYALGSQNGNPIYLKQSKIHFGINTYF